MSNLTKPTAAQAREAYHTLRSSLAPLALAKPVLHPDNPLLPDTTDDVTDQLPKAFQGRPLKVLINQFDVTGQPNDPVTVRLSWNGIAVGLSVRHTLPLDPAIFPIELALPQQQTVNAGRYDLGYIVNVVANPQPSEKQSINIDTMAPNGNIPGLVVSVPTAVEQDGITKEYLDANNGIVKVTVPEYGDAKIGDVIHVYYGDSIVNPKLFATVTRTDTTTPIDVNLTRADIGTEEGTKTIFYKLNDRVGNQGPYSEFKLLDVTLTPAPANLVPPKVPQADDGDIDRTDASEGVGVQIDAYTNAVLDTDKVIVTWDGIAQPAVDVAGFPTFVTVPFRDVKGSDEGPKKARATYVIERGSRRYTEPTGIEVDVDLRKPGPDNPDEPDPINPNLELVTVQAAVTTTPNTLEPADKGEDATASVQIYDQYKAGDIMQLYWKGVAVPGPDGIYNVTGQEDPTFDVPFTIPWAVIDTAGNDAALPVHYTIKNPAINDNEDISRPQPVSVSVNPITVPDPAFQNLYVDDDGVEFINCASLRNDPVAGWSVAVLVPGGEPRLANQELTFNYQGWLNDAGSTVKPGTAYEGKFTPTPEQANNGFIVSIPYDPPIITTRTDWGSIQYTAVLGGFPVTSVRHLVRVYVALTGGETCDLTP